MPVWWFVYFEGVGLIPQAQDDSTLVYFNADQSPSYTGESCVFGGHSCNYTGLLSDELASISVVEYKIYSNRELDASK